MEAFIKNKLRPVEECIVCTEPFSATHQPVTLDCKHIFGHKCIKKWLQNGRGDNATCPICRHVLVARKDSRLNFDAPTIWKRLCESSLGRKHIFMQRLWVGIRALWKRKPDGNFTISDLLKKIILPALREAGGETWSGSNNPFADANNLISASWESLGQPDRADGLAIPFVRLARLVSSTATTLPLYLTNLERTTQLIWKANACLGPTEENISWDTIIKASKTRSDPHFPLLHLYTALISQAVAHNTSPHQPSPTKRHEIMNMVVEKCCIKIGKGCYTGKPTADFKDALVVVFHELGRYQQEQGRLSLRGHDGEERIVKGLWAIAAWPIRRDAW